MRARSNFVGATFALGFIVTALMPSGVARADDAGAASAAGAAGECASGFCGTPNDNGGGCCCCCCSGSVLVNNTDIGVTYSSTDDYDGDGIADDFDNCPFIPNRTQLDSDGDMVGDLCDNCPSAANTNQSDINANGIGDVCDPDMDGDSIPNATDNCPMVANPDQADLNKNGIGDACDPDIDGDGILNAVDVCPFDPDPNATAADCVTDHDNDGVLDSTDNCIFVYNPNQSDVNNNKVGDVCDPDADSDTVPNARDNCVLVPNPDQADGDHDGIGDACDPVFCFVARDNWRSPCLDPTSTFAVNVGPNASAQTGAPVALSMYMNRNAPAKYTLTITTQPSGANDGVDNPVGTAPGTTEYEVQFPEGSRPTFTPTAPGTYTITLAADLVTPDSAYPEVSHAQATVDLTVTGAPTSASDGGCSTSGGSSSTGALALLGGLGALALVARRRRRTA